MGSSLDLGPRIYVGTRLVGAVGRLVGHPAKVRGGVTRPLWAMLHSSYGFVQPWARFEMLWGSWTLLVVNG